MQLKDELIISIDFGLKRTGLAVCNKGLSIGIPSKTIQTKSKDTQTIDLIIATYSEEIDRFILGLPLFLDGNESNMTLRVKEFGEKLKSYTGKPVHYIDERLTSEQSEDLLKQQGMNRKQRIPHKDSLSALLILKDFLDQENLH